MLRAFCFGLACLLASTGLTASGAEADQQLFFIIRIFPALVGRAAMPAGAALPPALQLLATRHARELSDSRWLHDIELLVKDLESARPARTG